MGARPELSILDLVSIAEGQTTAEAIATSLEAAQAADRLGYRRVWYAEHHNTDSVAASATAVLIGRAASLTENILVGAGGVMLPNHSPLMVAETYGTLAHMFPGRIELGLGRAPGTDPLTAGVLGRSSAEPNAFANHIYDMQGWLSETGRAHSVPIAAAAAQGSNVPMWVLGSSLAGAAIAGQLGLPYSAASHFAPQQTMEAIAHYRDVFDPTAPTAQIAEPRVMVAANVLVADTDEEAEFQFTTTRRMFVSVYRGDRGKLQPPGDLDESLELAMGDSMLRVRAVGAPATVAARLDELVAETDADDLITVTYTHDPAVRLRSLELLADVWAG